MDGGAMSEPLAVGTPAPDFTLRDANNEPIALHDFRGNPVVLIFYPLDWSPTCSDQLSLYQSELGEFARYGAKLLGISVDSIYSHGAWAAVRGIIYPLLADFEPKGERHLRAVPGTEPDHRPARAGLERRRGGSDGEVRSHARR